MTIKELKEKVSTLQSIYQKNKIERFLLSQNPKVIQLKEEIATSGLPYNELIKHLPTSTQSAIDMILLPPDNPLNCSHLTILEFEKHVKLSDHLSLNFWKINKKLARGNLSIKPYNHVFDSYNINTDGSITLEPLNFIELAKVNINSTAIPVDKLSERQLLYALCATVPYKNEATKKMIDAITLAYEYGNKKVALYNAAALSIMCNQLNLKIYGCKNHSSFLVIANLRTILIGEKDSHSVCLHELGHAIHFLLFGKVFPTNFLRLYHLCQINMKENEDAFQILISALNNYYLSIGKQFKTMEADIRKTAIDESLDKVIEEQINVMDDETLKQMITRYVLPQFQQLYFEMLETNKPKLLSDLKTAILNCSVNQIVNSNHLQDDLPGFGLDTISGIVSGHKFKFSNGNALELLTGHNEYYYNDPFNMFNEMFANYNVCKAYNNNVAIKQLKKAIGNELFNYLENIYDGYLNGLSSKRKTPTVQKNNESFETFYIEALNSSQIDIDKKMELLNSMNLAIYETENQTLYKLYNFLLPEFKFEQTQVHFINFLSNPNYFKENEQFKNFFSSDFLEELENNVNFGKLREFITQNFPDVTKQDGFNIIIQKNEANDKYTLYEGEYSYKLVKGYCRKFKSYYTTFGIKISVDERYNDENNYESLITTLAQLEIPPNIREIQISTQFENNIIAEVLSLKSITDLGDEITKYTTDEKKY